MKLQALHVVSFHKPARAGDVDAAAAHIYVVVGDMRVAAAARDGRIMGAEEVIADDLDIVAVDQDADAIVPTSQRGRQGDAESFNVHVADSRSVETPVGRSEARLGLDDGERARVTRLRGGKTNALLI